MPLSREDHLRLKLEQLEALKDHMGDINGMRLSGLRRGAVEAPADSDHGDEDLGLREHDTGDESPLTADEAGETDGEEEGEMELACPHCGEPLEVKVENCESCGGGIADEGGESDGARLEALAD